LTKTECYEISNSAILYALSLLQSSEIDSEIHLLSTEKGDHELEVSIKNSLKMLYENAPPNSVKRSLLYVLGGDNVPVGIINSISSLTANTLSQDGSRIDVTTSSSDETKVVMLSSVNSETIFEKYDPLGVIPSEQTLDWDEAECSINCELSLYQLE
jgi:cell division protein FtsZ